MNIKGFELEIVAPYIENFLIYVDRGQVLSYGFYNVRHNYLGNHKDDVDVALCDKFRIEFKETNDYLNALKMITSCEGNVNNVRIHYEDGSCMKVALPYHPKDKEIAYSKNIGLKYEKNTITVE